MTLLPSRVNAPIGLCGVLLAVLLAGGARPAHGQLWLQTARVVTPVQQGPIRVMLDSLTSVLERRGLEVRRSPEADTTMPVSALRNRLIEEQGIGINSANYVFIDYRFTIGNEGSLEQQFTNVHFVFRPGPTQSDVSVLSLDTQADWVRSFLREKGTVLPTNEAAFIPFRRHLSFAEVVHQDQTRIVEIGGQTVREGFQERKEALIRKMEWLAYEYLS
ncbi:MAG: hypothetical protein V5A22_05355 [Salinivenus sp.]